MTNTQIDYNHEVKNLNDLHYRHATIQCKGGYGVNPEVSMICRESTIYKGFIKDIDIDASDSNNIKRTLIVQSTEYGHEITLPYDKIIGMTILSSKEQALIEAYNHRKDFWLETIDNIKELSKEGNKHVAFEEAIEAFEDKIKQAEELIANGVKTFMWGF